MTEAETTDVPLQEISRETVKTELGTIAKSEILFRGVVRTSYAPGKLTDRDIEKLLIGIETAEVWLGVPDLIRNLKSLGTTPERRIEEGANQLIDDLRNRRFPFAINNSVFSPLIVQRALGILFNEAQQAQVPQNG